MELQKIYLNRNYRDVTCGSVYRVRKVYSESTDRGTRYYIEGDEQDRSILKQLHYLEADPLGSLHPLPYTEGADKEIVLDTVEKEPEKVDEVVDDFDKAPDEYYCQDHGEMHKRGEPEYYGCVQKFLTGKWDGNVDPGKDQTEPATEQPKPIEPEKEPAAPVTEVDSSLHELNARSAMLLIAKATNGEELTALYKSELSHPMFPKGRVGIKNGIKKAFRNLRLPIPDLE